MEVDTQYVDQDEYAALEALLFSAERRSSELLGVRQQQRAVRAVLLCAPTLSQSRSATTTSSCLHTLTSTHTLLQASTPAAT